MAVCMHMCVVMSWLRGWVWSTIMAAWVWVGHHLAVWVGVGGVHPWGYIWVGVGH